MTIRVLDPTLDADASESCLAPALSSLKGRTIGFVDNGKFGVGRFLNHLEQILRSEHGVGEVVRRVKPDASRPLPAEMLAELRACDAIVSAVGD